MEFATKSRPSFSRKERNDNSNDSDSVGDDNPVRDMERGEPQMTQYCRYCSFCIEGDALYCTDHEELLSDSQVRRVNHCKDFALSELGDIFTGRQYKPRKGKPLKAYDGCEQLEMELI